jgi:hypothetical protein
MFAGGSEIFLAVLVVTLVGVILELYTRKGSGIDHHPYVHVHGDAPGAALPCETEGSDRTAQEEARAHRAALRAQRKSRRSERRRARLEQHGTRLNQQGNL